MRTLRYILIIIAVLVTAIAQAANTDPHIIVTGRVTAEGRGVSGVPITDGYTVVTTTAKGQYEIKANPDAKFIYYTLPSGYCSPAENCIPQFFRKIDRTAARQKADFDIGKSTLPQDKHSFIVWADPQVLFVEEFEQLKQVVEDIRQTARSSVVPMHALSAGDNVFDRLDYFGIYKEVISAAGIPFYHSVGNHDMDYNERSNELSDLSYTDAFGPSHYSFNVGDVHYVVLKDVFYFGYSYHYMGYITEQQLSWLEDDLRLVAQGSTVVLTMHIPAVFGNSAQAHNSSALERNSVMNNGALFKILEPYNTHIMTGHSHIQWNTLIAPNLMEHTHGAASAAWWQGEFCRDGTPKGYTVYEADGGELTWYFKGVGLDKKEQLRIYYDGNELIANVFNYDPRWKVEWLENGEVMGRMEQYWGIDPLARELYPPGGNKVHSWLSYGETNHLFRAVPKDKLANIDVVVTDRFGNVYTKTAPEVWKLVWSDEFNYNGLPDEARWSYDTNGNASGWGNNEAQHYTSHNPDNAYVSDGTLKIVARKEAAGGKRYTSARLYTKDKGDWLYGKFDIRAKLPRGRGAWSAIWMLPTGREYGHWPHSGEIDIMENVGYDSDTIVATAHTGRYNHKVGTNVAGRYYLPTTGDRFHTYSLEWDDKEWRAYVDGDHYYTHKNELSGTDVWPFDKPFHLILNLAIGGDWGGKEGIDDELFPKVFEIDYVRVYQKAE